MTKMKGKIKNIFSWTDLELEGLLEDEDSHVFFERVKKHTAFHPAQLHNVKGAVHDYLQNFLNSYDPSLKGLILSYKNPKLLNEFGTLVYDKPDIHVDIEAEFYIFRPEIGHSLKGIVNKEGTNHLGLLIHKAFNVSVPKPDDEEDWPGHKVCNGQEIRFTVTELDYKLKIPYIRGSLHEEDYLNGCQLFCNKLEEEHDNRTFSEVIDAMGSPAKMKLEKMSVKFNSDDSEVEQMDERDKKKLLKKKLKNIQLHALTDGTLKKKKIKHKKDQESDSEESSLLTATVKMEPESEVEDNVKHLKLKKENKKEKHIIQEDVFKMPKPKRSLEGNNEELKKKTKKVKKTEVLQYESEAEDRKRAKDLLKKELNLLTTQISDNNVNELESPKKKSKKAKDETLNWYKSSTLYDSEVEKSQKKVLKLNKSHELNKVNNIDYSSESEIEDKKREKAALREQLNLPAEISDVNEVKHSKKKLKTITSSILTKSEEKKDESTLQTKKSKKNLVNSQTEDQQVKEEKLSNTDAVNRDIKDNSSKKKKQKNEETEDKHKKSKKHSQLMHNSDEEHSPVKIEKSFDNEVSDRDVKDKSSKKKKLPSTLENVTEIEKSEDKLNLQHKKSKKQKQPKFISEVQDSLVKVEEFSENEKEGKKYKASLKRRLSEESSMECIHPKKKSKHNASDEIKEESKDKKPKKQKLTKENGHNASNSEKDNSRFSDSEDDKPFSPKSKSKYSPSKSPKKREVKSESVTDDEGIGSGLSKHEDELRQHVRKRSHSIVEEFSAKDEPILESKESLSLFSKFDIKDEFGSPKKKKVKNKHDD